MNIGEGWNVDRLVYGKLHLFAQLLFPDDGPVQLLHSTVTAPNRLSIFPSLTTLELLPLCTVLLVTSSGFLILFYLIIFLLQLC